MISYDEFGLYDISLKLTDYGPQPFTIPVRYGFEFEEMDPKFNIAAIDDQVTFNALNTFPVSEWYINGDLKSTETSFVLQLADGIHEVTHIVRDASNNEATYTTLLRMKNGDFFWLLNYDYCTAVDQNNYGKMIVSFKRNGIWYKSSKDLNNVSEFFNLGPITYILEESGTPSMAFFDINFDAILKDDSQSLTLDLDNVSGTIAVGLK